MTTATHVLGVRYGYHSEEEGCSAGADGIIVLQEVGGIRHGALMFAGAIGTEILEAQYRNPGEPVLCHELFLEMLTVLGVTVTKLDLVNLDSDEARPGVITFGQGETVWTRQCSAYDLVGFSISSKIPIDVESSLFDEMHAAAPPLAAMMAGAGDPLSLETAERLALFNGKIGNA